MTEKEKKKNSPTIHQTIRIIFIKKQAKCQDKINLNNFKLNFKSTETSAQISFGLVMCVCNLRDSPIVKEAGC